jgi:uncharacterized protein (TIGR02186 family)
MKLGLRHCWRSKAIHTSLGLLHRLYLLAMTMGVLMLPCAVKAQNLTLELASPRVDITTGFNGTQVAVFGATDIDDAGVVITLKGPENTVVMRHKSRVLGAWMNTESVEFRRVPSYYDYASVNVDLAALPVDVAKSNQIGLSNLDFYPEDTESDEEAMAYREALIGTLQQKGFYALNPASISMIQPQFFKAVFDLPPGVPTGIYTVEGVLIRNDKMLARTSETLQVGQVGFNARVYNFATEGAFGYGIFSIVIALVFGWSAFTFLRRD